MIWLLSLLGCIPSEQAPDACFQQVYIDEDGDGAVSVAPVGLWTCGKGVAAWQSEAGDDCDDDAPGTFPGATETCSDAIDQDCDGADRVESVVYSDLDADGFGDPATEQAQCYVSDGMVPDNTDCDDEDGEINPLGQDDVCSDGLDGNCDDREACALEGVLIASAVAERALDEGTSSEAGYSLDLAGDLDGDGFQDVVVGGPGLGSAWAIYGGLRGAEEVMPVLAGEAGKAGTGVAGVGDINGDGRSEMIITSPESNDAGVARGGIAGLYYGTPKRPPGDMASLSGETPELRLGTTVAGGGGTLVLSTYNTDTGWAANPLYAPPGPGEVLTLGDDASPRVSGLSLELGEQPILFQDGETLLVGDPWYDETTIRSNLGAVYLYASEVSGDTDVTDADFAAMGSSLLGDFGSALAMVDIDGTGTAEVLVGDPGRKTTYIYMDPDTRGAVVADADADIAFTAEDNAGVAVAGVGDTNGDGLDDFAVGSSESGLIWLFLGQTGWTSSLSPEDATATLVGPGGSGFGASVTGGDLDADGWTDVVVGAPTEGQVWLFYGGVEGPAQE